MQTFCTILKVFGVRHSDTSKANKANKISASKSNLYIVNEHKWLAALVILNTLLRMEPSVSNSCYKGKKMKMLVNV